MAEREPMIVLYDGVCGLCNRIVQFVLRHDREDAFRFAALQSEFGRTLLLRHGKDPEELNTLYLVIGEEGSERLLVKGRAALHILKHLGGVWRPLAFTLGIFPTFLLNFGYDLVAGNRYKIFGRLDACPMPNPKDRHKFIET